MCVEVIFSQRNLNKYSITAIYKYNSVVDSFSASSMFFFYDLDHYAEVRSSILTKPQMETKA